MHARNHARTHLAVCYKVELLWCVFESRQHGLGGGVHEAQEGLVASVKASIVRYVLPQSQVPVNLR